MEKVSFIKVAINLISSKNDVDLSQELDKCKKLIKTRDQFLTPHGIALRNSIKDVEDYTSKRNSSSFMNEFWTFFKKYPQFEKTAVCDLFKNAMKRFQGDKSSYLTTQLRNLFMVLYTIDPKAAKFLSGNVFGPTEKNMINAAKKVDTADASMSNFYLRSPVEAANDIISYVEGNYNLHHDVIAMSLSIDATKVAYLIQEDLRYKKIVGGAVPYHCIDSASLSTDEKIKIIESFHEKGSKHKKADEIKVATAVFQVPPKSNIHLSPYNQIMARPQTKNQNSNFNHEACKAAVIAEEKLRQNGWKFSFTNACNDGVSSDTKFVHSVLNDFLEGKINYTAGTDTNHNTKSARYQDVLGGNSVKTIGSYLIDTGMITKAGVASRAVQVKDFASDALVLELFSSNTIEKILELKNEDTETQMTLCLVLFFMRVHLFAVNCKGVLTANERVTMVWTSMIFFLHIDGAHVTTKRNWINETISLCFLMLREDVLQPHRLTSEPSEHTFALLRSMIREFTALDFLNLVRKLNRFWVGLKDGKLKFSRERNYGYGSTIESHFYRGIRKLSGTVKVNYLTADNGFVKAGQSEVCTMAIDLWKTLQTIINNVNKEMKILLKSTFGVTEFHPLIEEFNSLVDFRKCFHRCTIDTDNGMFKNEAFVDKLSDNEGVDEDSVSVTNHDDDDDGVEREARHESRDPCDNELRKKLRDRMINHVIAAERRDTYSNDNDLDEINAESYYSLIDEVTCERSGVFQSFIEVLSGASKNVMKNLLQHPNIIVVTMNKMKLVKREKGTIP